MEWKNTLPMTKKFKSKPSAGEVILTLFWDFNCAILEEEFISAICSKCKGMLINGVVLHHDNARCHTAAATVKTIQK
jgi:hypothetical protein